MTYRKTIRPAMIAEHLPENTICCLSVRPVLTEQGVSEFALRRAMATYVAIKTGLEIQGIVDEFDSPEGNIQFGHYFPLNDKRDNPSEPTLIAFIEASERKVVEALNTDVLERIEHFESTQAFSVAFEVLMRDQRQEKVH